MDTKVAKAKAELRSIHLKIQDLAERKSALEKFLDVYAEFSADESPIDDTDTDDEPRRPSSSSTAKAKILVAVAQLLAEGRHAYTRELVNELQAINVEIGGADKIQALSAILSKDSRFISSRKLGWSLLDPKTAEPASVGADAGSFF